jgi:hypothetical protein
MAKAEAIGPDIDFMLRYCYLGLFGMSQGLNQRDFLKGFRGEYMESRKRVDTLQFQSLQGIENDA